MATSEAKLADQRALQNIAQEQGEEQLWPKETAHFTPPFLKKIGIDYPAPTVGNGYLKLLYRDFIVEEITAEGRIVSIEPEAPQDFAPPESASPKYAADLVKQGIDTFEAAELLSTKLGIPTLSIGFAGLKDNRAITAQEVSFNGTTLEALRELKLPQLFLKHIRPRDGVLASGNLYGNRFTIYVRTAGVDLGSLDARIEEIRTHGVYNFYSLQRFGNRLITHDIGRLILQGNYEEAVKLTLTGSTPHESQYFQSLREQAATCWGKWDELVKIYSTLPFFLRHELTLASALQREPGNFAGALRAASDQTKFATYAYSSYWFNRLLSHHITQGSVPDELPVISESPESHAAYQAILPNEELRMLKFRHPDLPFLFMRPTQVKTRIHPDIHSVTPLGNGIVFHFDLMKGAYATTLLSQVFNLYQGKPVPDWVDTTQVDPRARISYRPLTDTEALFPPGEEPLPLIES